MSVRIKGKTLTPVSLLCSYFLSSRGLLSTGLQHHLFERKSDYAPLHPRSYRDFHSTQSDVKDGVVAYDDPPALACRSDLTCPLLIPLQHTDRPPCHSLNSGAHACPRAFAPAVPLFSECSCPRQPPGLPLASLSALFKSHLLRDVRTD